MMSDLHGFPGDVVVWGCPLQQPRGSFIYSDESWRILYGLQCMDEASEFSGFQKKILSGIIAPYDVFAVGPKQSGKRSATLLLVLTHALASRAETPLMNRAAAPSVIIVCSSVTAALSMEFTVKSVLENGIENTEERPTVLMLDSLTDDKVLTSLHTQVDVLLLTQKLLAQLLSQNPSNWLISRLELQFHRLKYVLFEELSMAEPRMSLEIIKFLGYLGVITSENMSLACPEPPKNVQVLFLGTNWNDYANAIYEALKTNGRQTVMICGSTFHALQYAQLKWTVKHCTHESVKFSLLRELCEQMIMDGRSLLIACRTSELACKISKALTNTSAISHTLYTLKGVEKVGLFKTSCEEMNRIYVVSDNAINLPQKNNISCLIYFDIGVPSNKVLSWPFHPKRFVSIWRKICFSNDTTTKALVYLFVTGSEPNLLNLSNYLKSLSIDYPSSLKNTVGKLNEMRAPKLPICSTFKWFGQCDKMDGLCLNRHKFLSQDLRDPAAPAQGELELKVISCQSPSIYIGLMLRHFVFQNGKRECVKSYVEELEGQISQLTEYYNIEGNRVRPTEVSVGDLFCIRNSFPNPSKEVEDKYLRVKIIDADRVCALNLPELSPYKHFEVFYIDIGIRTRIHGKDLLVMPQEAKQWPPHAVEVVLSNIFPPKHMEEYTSSGIRAARELTQEGAGIWNVKILLAIGNTVWVNPMVTLEQDSITGRIINARTTLVSRKHASLKPYLHNMFGLLQLIRVAQPDYPEFPHERNQFVPTVKQIERRCTEFHQPGSFVSWASIPLSSMDSKTQNIHPVNINLGTVISPWKIYGTPQSKDNRAFQILPVTYLETSLLKDVEQLLLQEFPGKRELFLNYFVTGGVVAVKPPEKLDRWARGLITETNSDDDSSTKFTVFLVDHGVHIYGIREENMVPLFQKYVEMLSFQAFSFMLTHIRPWNFGPWGEESKAIFSNIMDTFSPNKNEVTLIALKSENSKLGCYHYSALAFVHDANGISNVKEIELGLHYVNMGYAKLAENAEELLELVTVGTEIPKHDESKDETANVEDVPQQNLQQSTLMDAEADENYQLTKSDELGVAFQPFGTMEAPTGIREDDLSVSNLVEELKVKVGSIVDRFSDLEIAEISDGHDGDETV